MMTRRIRGHVRTATGILFTTLTLLLLCHPTNLYAALADEIETAIQTKIREMVGTEFGVDYITFDFLGVELTATVVGFAFCVPADPYAPPDPTPVENVTVYGCENLTTVGAVVANDESSAEVTVEISDIFLDLETSRDETVACLLWGDTFPYTGTVTEDGYMLAHATVSVGLALEFVDGCYRAGLVPGSTAFTLEPDVIASLDECLDSNMVDVVQPILYPLVQDYLDAVFEAALLDVMGEISDLICAATPDVSRSWGDVKGSFR